MYLRLCFFHLACSCFQKNNAWRLSTGVKGIYMLSRENESHNNVLCDENSRVTASSAKPMGARLAKTTFDPKHHRLVRTSAVLQQNSLTREL